MMVKPSSGRKRVIMCSVGYKANDSIIVIKDLYQKCGHPSSCRVKSSSR